MLTLTPQVTSTPWPLPEWALTATAEAALTLYSRADCYRPAYNSDGHGDACWRQLHFGYSNRGGYSYGGGVENAGKFFHIFRELDN